MGRHAGHAVNLKLVKICPTLRELEEARGFFPRLTTILFCIPVARASVSNFKQFIHEKSKYIVTEALI